MFSENLLSKFSFEKRPVNDTKAQDFRNLYILYDTYAPAIYGLLLGWVKDENSAQVILQQTFLAYAEGISRYENDRPFICLLRIARKKSETYVAECNSIPAMSFTKAPELSYVSLS